jgi:2,4-diketo-3-deoxy-L-fuconate hydrolase
MKICRYDEHRVGLVEGDTVRDVTAVLEALGTFAYPLPRFDPRHKRERRFPWTG